MDELKIIQYLDGEMSAEERESFEDEIRMNPELAREIERFRKFQSLAEDLLADHETEEKVDPAAEKEIEDSVREFKKDPGSYGHIPGTYRENLERAAKSYHTGQASSGSMSTVRRIWYSAAALVILALGTYIIAFKPFAKMSASEIYAEYFAPFRKTGEIIELARADNDFLFATEVYEAGDYERSAVLFDILADSSGMKNWSLFYAGCSYMGLNKSAEAIDRFSKVIENGDSRVVPDARWQLALCYLKTGEREKAVELLEILAEDPAYRRDVVRILRFLR